MSKKILSINPGSTTTKIGLYEGRKKVFTESIEHDSKELDKYDEIVDQLDFRTQVIKVFLEEKGVNQGELSAIVGRGGLLPNIKGGGYRVTEKMVEAIKSGKASPHASNLGALLAFQLAEPLKIPSYIYDSVTSDEFADIAKMTGLPDVKRESMCHVLNTKAMCRKLAESQGKKYEDLTVIAVHLGGGISLSLHHKGKIIDGISDDAGPFSPERAGSIPLLYMVKMCYSGDFNRREMVKRIRGLGGMKAYLGTSDCRQIEKMIAEGNELARKVYDAQAYQIAKGIGQLAPVVKGKVDHILLTGGIANSHMLTNMIAEYVRFISPVVIMPGEDELEALTLGALRMANGQEEAKEY